eukprot:6208715-Pleurochrysis_carterae.AAC.7
MLKLLTQFAAVTSACSSGGDIFLSTFRSVLKKAKLSWWQPRAAAYYHQLPNVMGQHQQGNPRWYTLYIIEHTKHNEMSGQVEHSCSLWPAATFL